ncbi:MAG TPA: peptidase, partial [Planctomycetota bacterium]|nr:peptidase [Planctomycetota bacterium]
VKVGTFVQDAAAEGGERRTRREEFYIPGSLVALEVDTQHPVAAGTSMQVATMFNAGSPVFEVTGPGVEVIARYRQIDTLVSGWAIGEEYLAGKAAVVAAKVGKGRILLYGADVTYRGQPLGSAKLFFHGILTAVGPQ